MTLDPERPRHGRAVATWRRLPPEMGMKFHYVLLTSLLLSACSASPPADPPEDPSKYPRVVSTQVIGPFSGHDAKLHPDNEAPLKIEYYGTDLGFSYEHKGLIYFLFGDTWATEAYAPIEASTGPSFDDGWGVVDPKDWPDPARIDSNNIPLIKLAQNPGTTEMSAMNPGHILDLGKTPMSGFSNGNHEFAIFNVTKPMGCHTDAECGADLTCDTGLGYLGAAYSEQASLTLPCVDGSPGCNADTQKAETHKSEAGAAISGSGFCVDTGSTVRGETPAGRAQSVALNQRIGRRDDKDPRHYVDIHQWLTNRFVNMTARTVARFEPGNGTQAPQVDYRTGVGRGNGQRVFLWGRPGFVGVGANGRSLGLYFAYVDMPTGPGFSWDVNYYTGNLNGIPQFSTREKDAQPLDLDASQEGIQAAEKHDVTHQMSVVWIAQLNKWVMLYGGGVTTLPSPVLPLCGVLQLFAGTECKDVVMGDSAIHMRTADHPWGPWSPPQDVIAGGDPAVPGSGQFGVTGVLRHPACTEPGCATHTQTAFYNKDEYGFFYSANIIEQWTTPAGKGVDILWNASTWDPYRVVLLRTRIEP